MSSVPNALTGVCAKFLRQAHFARVRLKWRIRAFRGRVTAWRFGKVARSFNPRAQVVTIGKVDRVSGLSRSYRYELERMAQQGAAGQTDASDQTFIIFGQPRSYRKLLGSAPKAFRSSYRIGLWVTEFETVPPDWRLAFQIVHEIWTPSTFCADAIRAATDLPVKVMPHPVSLPDVRPLERARFGVERDHFLGLGIMDLRTCPDRKNPVAHVLAWKSAFGDDDAAHLVLKVSFSKRTQFMKQDLLSAINGAGNITITEVVLTDSEMTAFQKMADVYLSLHRSEGYGLNIKEMLELGVPTLATGWSGNMDFMPHYANAVEIPFELVPYEDRTSQYEGDNLRWAEADIDYAAEALRQVRDRWNLTRSGYAQQLVG